MYEHVFGPIKQWGFLVRDFDQALGHWVKTVGLGPWWIYRGVEMESHFRGKVTEVVMDVAMGYLNGVQVELVQQTNDTMSPYRFFYEGQDAQLLHQLGYAVDDLDAAVARARDMGLTEYGVMKNAFGSVVYMETPALAPVVLELIPATPDYMGFYDMCAKEAASWDGNDPFRQVG